MKLKYVLLFVMVLFLLVSGAMALGNGRFSLPWWTVDGGGGTSQGSTFTVSGTMGQTDAGTASGNVFTLTGGFWGQTPMQPSLTLQLYLPVIQTHDPIPNSQLTND